MYLFSGKKTKIYIQYEENTAHCELSPYETLNHLKQIIIQFFPQITSNHILHINNSTKAINEYDEFIQISELTKGKSNLKLLITKPKRPSTPSIETNDFNSTSNSINKFKCKCTQFSISHYCSNCKEFICLQCKITSHCEHKTISIDIQSIDESVKLFAISLQADISNEMNNYIQIENMFKENMLIDFFSWKEMIIRKLDKIEIFFKNFEEFEKIFKKKFGTIERMASLTSNKIEKISNEYYTDKNKMNIDKAKEVIEYLNQSSEIIRILIDENASRREEFHTNSQINGLFSDLDKIIDKVEALSLISYQEIKKRTEADSLKSDIRIKRDFNYFNSNDDYNDLLSSNKRYSEGIVKNNIMVIKSNTRNNRLIMSKMGLNERGPHSKDIIKLQSFSAISPENNHLRQSQYMKTDFNDRDININTKVINLQNKIPFSTYNTQSVVLPQLSCNKN